MVMALRPGAKVGLVLLLSPSLFHSCSYLQVAPTPGQEREGVQEQEPRSANRFASMVRRYISDKQVRIGEIPNIGLHHQNHLNGGGGSVEGGEDPFLHQLGYPVESEDDKEEYKVG